MKFYKANHLNSVKYSSDVTTDRGQHSNSNSNVILNHVTDSHELQNKVISNSQLKLKVIHLSLRHLINQWYQFGSLRKALEKRPRA